MVGFYQRRLEDDTSNGGADDVWILCSTGSIIFMQAGYQFFEAATISKTNRSNAVVKSFIGICLSALSFYLIGYGLGFGENNGIFAGHTLFVGQNIKHFRDFAFQYSFCAEYTETVLEVFSERATIEFYLILVPIISGLLYPIPVSWTWGEGWLFHLGFSDFAGGAIVHLAAGTCALAGAIMIGQRKEMKAQGLKERIESNPGTQVNSMNNTQAKMVRIRPKFETEDQELQPSSSEQSSARDQQQSQRIIFQTHMDIPQLNQKPAEQKQQPNIELMNQQDETNISYAGIGIIFIWFGWLSFNAGCSLSVQTANNQIEVERALMNTMIGPAASGIMNLFLRRWLTGNKVHRGIKYDPMAIFSGILCGLVAVTPNCAYTHAWASIVICGTAPIFYCLASRLLNKLNIDDPGEAFSIHGVCGAWGTFCCGIFNLQNGAIYGNNGRQIGIQLLGIVAIFGWHFICMLLIFLPIKLLIKYKNIDIMRVNEQVETEGLDKYYHLPYVKKIQLQSEEVISTVNTEEALQKED